jgi:hypothetical protein
LGTGKKAGTGIPVREINHPSFFVVVVVIVIDKYRHSFMDDFDNDYDNDNRSAPPH